MFTTSTSVRRAALRIGVGVTAAVAAAVSLPGAAQAHVTIQPPTAEGGGFSVVAIRVPNERDDASTTRVQVTLPEDQPLGSVSTTPIEGWSIKTATRKLDEPIEMFGAKLDTVVSQVTWTATAGGVRPGQFEDFELSLGQLPESGRLNFTALQSYSSGEQVRWNEVAADAATEPEHPAPSLLLTAPSDEGAGNEQASDESTGGTESQSNVSAVSDPDDEGVPVLPTVLSAAALVVALGAAGLAWRRGRA